MYSLYYKPLACSLAVHIVLIELNLAHELLCVSKAGNVLMSGDRPLSEIHIPATVPLLKTPAGDVMAETAVILEYLAEQVEEGHLFPDRNDKDYWKYRQMMNFIATDIHKNYGPLFNADISEPMKDVWMRRFKDRLSYVQGTISDEGFIYGMKFSAVDCYLFVMLHWTSYVGIDLQDWPNLKRYYDNLSGRPSVRQALAIEVP